MVFQDTRNLSRNKNMLVVTNQRTLHCYIEHILMCEAWIVTGKIGNIGKVVLEKEVNTSIDSKRDRHRYNGRNGPNKVSGKQKKKTTGCLHWSHNEKGRFNFVCLFGWFLYVLVKN